MGRSIQKNDTKLTLINNLLFILLCKVPHISDLEFLQRTDGRYTITKTMWPKIAANYKKYARYDMKTILPPYYEYMNAFQSEGGQNMEILYLRNKQKYLSLLCAFIYRYHTIYQKYR